jgi:2-dehydropantoate 2-reductase
MNIVVFGAGAIGSLFGGLLSKQNPVVLIGRTPHVQSIQQTGLLITGKTQLKRSVYAIDSPNDLPFSPDIILLTVKSYDTETACDQIRRLLQDGTMVISFQNGLDNLEKIEHAIDKKHILAGVTTHGAFYERPGRIIHTGSGGTYLGEIDGQESERLQLLLQIFNQAGIKTQGSRDIKGEIWKKAIINSSINPLTGFLGCKNGYLLENPLLEKIVESVCMESSGIASSNGILISASDMQSSTKKVINETAENFSSMLQSIQQGKKTEIDSINGVLIRLGTEQNIETPSNQILYELIISLSAP